MLCMRLCFHQFCLTVLSERGESYKIKENEVSCKASYSLISIRQNYHFHILAIIWHEIVCWFLKVYQDLKRFAAQEHKIVLVLTFRCAKKFHVPNMQEQSKGGKKSEINIQTFVIWRLNARRYGSVWYLSM